MKIAILGAGAFGTALGGVLAANGYDIDYYDSKLERERLGDVLKNALAVVLCVPSAVAPYLLPHLPLDKTLIVAEPFVKVTGFSTYICVTELYERWITVTFLSART